MADDPRMALKVPEKVLPGVYANQMTVRHTREEFLIDFINRFPPRGIVAARVIVSPGHLKRMVRALGVTVRRFETTHGPIVLGVKAAASAPDAPPQAEPQAQRTIRPGDLVASVPESVLAGVYANQMVISHTREEFLLDFVNVFPPESIVTSRVFVSPEQVKRMIGALRENMVRYETAHGAIIEAVQPQPDSLLN